MDCEAKRIGKLESQKWRLLRLWSPQLFRNPAAAIARIKKSVDEWLAEEAAKKAAVSKERSLDARLLNCNRLTDRVVVRWA